MWKLEFYISWCTEEHFSQVAKTKEAPLQISPSPQVLKLISLHEKSK